MKASLKSAFSDAVLISWLRMGVGGYNNVDCLHEQDPYISITPDPVLPLMKFLLHLLSPGDWASEGKEIITFQTFTHYEAFCGVHCPAASWLMMAGFVHRSL